MRAVIVIPCYNEAERLSPVQLTTLLEDPRCNVLFVNDGSSDRTHSLLKELSDANPGRVKVLNFHSNQGKAEAVRQGLLFALGAGSVLVGFADADFATPPCGILRLLDEIEHTGAEIVLGSRVSLLGTNIKRSPVRHILGRIFATVASFAVGTPVYDTQCGAKLFRATAALQASLALPFSSRWSFDVELLCRLFGRLETTSATDVAKALEVPLRHWSDVEGSKLHIGSMAKAFAELLLILARVACHIRKR